MREGGVAEGEGLRSGDELALISDKSVMELGWVEVERLMSGKELKTTVCSFAIIHYHNLYWNPS